MGGIAGRERVRRYEAKAKLEITDGMGLSVDAG